jgi:hypothetical protein
VADTLILPVSGEREMTNNVLTVAVLAALGWTFTNAPAPVPLSHPPAPQATTPGTAVAAPVIAASRVLEAHQPPVPLVRTVRNLPAQVTPAEIAMPESEAKAQDSLDERAAKAAIETDGYKRVSMLGKSADGTWRAKAYRGATDVRLTVDAAGRVSAD